MITKKCVAYIDILGFKGHITSELPNAQKSAIEMLGDINGVFLQDWSESNLNPWQNYEHGSPQQSLVKRISVDSFENFLSMSDSIFITGNNANDFLDQLSSFLCRCFILTSNEYKNKTKKNNIESVSIKSIDQDKNGKLITNEEERQWFPLIFRGGVSFGEVSILEMASLMRDKMQYTPNIAGTGHVKAVELEKCGGKGPKLYLDKDIVKELDENHKALLKTENISGKKVSHYLWPAHFLIRENDLEWELSQKYSDSLEPAINLWNAYKDENYAPHYLEFVKLIINSYVAVAQQLKGEEEGKKIIKDFLQKYDSVGLFFDL